MKSLITAQALCGVLFFSTTDKRI